jgi:toxin ParE1/3/4
MIEPRYTETAEADMVAIWEWIARTNENAADRLVEEIRVKASLHVKFPRSGRPRENLRPNLRSFVVGNYVVFYRPSNDTIEIIRVLHGSRDIDSIMRDSTDER